MMIRLVTLAVLVLGAAVALAEAPVPQVHLAALRTPVVDVTDGDTLILDSEKMRLIGIDAPELHQTCNRADGTAWPCGRAAKAALAALVANDPGLDCAGSSRDRYGRLLVTCKGRYGDLGQAMVAQGMAQAYRKYSMAYVGVEQSARGQGLGIWQGENQRPEDYRAAEAVAVAAPIVTASQVCRIKGNISSNGRIYHLPGQDYYDRTRITLANGERWFCTETEARVAGWRKAG